MEVEEAKLWVPLLRPRRHDRSRFGRDGATPPELLITVQMVPAADIERLPAGPGRSAPNANPTLPKPSGRIRFTINPFALCYQVLGPTLCRRLVCLLWAIVCLLILYYMIPVVLADLFTYGLTSAAESG